MGKINAEQVIGVECTESVLAGKHLGGKSFLAKGLANRHCAGGNMALAKAGLSVCTGAELRIIPRHDGAPGGRRPTGGGWQAEDIYCAKTWPEFTQAALGKLENDSYPKKDWLRSVPSIYCYAAAAGA